MQIVAFLFAGDDVAESAIAQMRADHWINGVGVATAPLSVDGVDGTIVALPIELGARDGLVAVAAKHGGRLVADVPEEWTHGRSPEPH